MSSTPSTNWFSRNWKWFVPTLFIGAVVLMVGFLALVVTTVFGFMKSSDVYKEAVARSKTSPAVVRALGSPIKEGFLITGNINVFSSVNTPGTNTSTGNANLQIPIYGPNGKAVIHVIAKKSNGKWTFQKLTVIIQNTGEKIDLLSPVKGSLTTLPEISPCSLYYERRTTFLPLLRGALHKNSVYRSQWRNFAAVPSRSDCNDEWRRFSLSWGRGPG